MRQSISYSEFQLWGRCQQRWKLDYLEKRRTKVYGVHMDFGTSIHFAIEMYKDPKNELGITLPIAIFIFEEEMKYLYNKNLEHYKESDRKVKLDFFLDAGRNILSRFDELDEIRDAEVVWNEYELDVPIDRTDDVNIKFHGFIDMVIKTKDKRGNTILYVCDFKTCSWGWGPEKRQDRSLHFQILLYKHFLCKKFDLDPKLVRTAFVLLKKRPPKGAPPVEWFSLSAGPVSTQRAVDHLNSAISEIRARDDDGAYAKNRKECKNDFGEVCPHYGTELCTND